MLIAVHKLIDEMTEKTTISPPSVSQPSTYTTSSQPNVASSVPLSSPIRERSPIRSEVLKSVPEKRIKHTATK